MKYWRGYKYKNLTFLIIGFIVAFFLFNNESFHSFLINLGSLGYMGAFIGGLFFTSTFTVATGTIILLVLAKSLSPIEIGLIAASGSVIGDLIIFQFIKSKGFADEIKKIIEYFGGDKVSHLLHTRYFSWTLPVLGAVIIASPLPDELGISLMGISKMKLQNFILLSFVLNSIGIFLVVSASTILKP